ncbi:SGNH/GDSL hydrolase family protein [Curtobacterium aetherium]|uniref:SGNH/GDSL hydrolase family protein n=1 Tax=Curtobacterium aetherium TaxID=2841594 RepID=A0ACD1E2T6_9MICO|nr:SGNH/GDSL hydrolase family protein [Curtobacterium sp. L6-1]QWS33282.1 SGNH/GDSL hydrolase family protein [Curtobacterium sp. L6-1]
MGLAATAAVLGAVALVPGVATTAGHGVAVAAVRVGSAVVDGLGRGPDVVPAARLGSATGGHVRVTDGRVRPIDGRRPTGVPASGLPGSEVPAGTVRVDAARTWELDHTPHQVLTGPVGPATAGAVTFAYAGDSVTARPGSWLRDLATDPAVHALDGYAHSGYRADQVAALMPTVPGADVLVVELGTNDVNQAVPAARTVAAIDALVARVGAPHVLVVDTPPSDHTTSLWGVDRRSGNAALNRDLAVDAGRHGWTVVDPFAADRTADGAWTPGTTLDGIHPTTAANTAIARAFSRAIVAAGHATGTGS